jgi:uncharacterized protein
VIIPDVNVLLYAHISAFPQHARAREWWRAALEAEDVAVGLTTPAILGFVRIGTNRKVFREPLSVDNASETVRAWLAFPNVTMLSAGPSHVETVLTLLKEAGTNGNLTTDAQLAAYAIEYQAELCSNDADFGRFSGLRWVNPLKTPQKKPRGSSRV